MSSFNKVGGRYGMHSGSGRFKNFQVDQNMFIQGNPVGPIGPGNTWYVDKNVNANGTGKTWELAFKTVTAAVAAAQTYDTIIIGKGLYDEAATLTITQRGLRIIGPGNGGTTMTNGLISTTSASDIMIINADYVEISGISFFAVTNAKSALIIGDGYDSWNTWVHDCAFSTGTADNTLGEYGIDVSDALDCVNTLIENNFFYYMSSAAIYIGATRCTVRNNIIWSNSVGIDVTHEGGEHAGCLVADNYLIGRQSGSTVGIQLAATEPTDGYILVANNIVTNFDTNITAGKAVMSQVNNQTAADASTYLQVDASS